MEQSHNEGGVPGGVVGFGVGEGEGVAHAGPVCGGGRVGARG